MFSRNYSLLAYNGTGGVPSMYRNLKNFCETAPIIERC